MFSSQPHSVRAALTALVALSCLALLSPAFGRPERSGFRDRAPDEREAKGAPANRAHRPAPPSPTDQTKANPPGRAGPQARPLYAVPFSPPRETRPGQRSVSATPAPAWSQMWYQPQARPDSETAPRGRRESRTLYPLYRAPDNENPPETKQRKLQMQPTAFSVRLRDDTARLTAPSGAQRQFRAPRADFRGPEADRQVRAVPRDEGQRMQHQFQNRLREQNRAAFRPDRARPTRDVVGNTITADAALILRDGNSRISISYGRISHDCGPPAHHYFFVPRSPDDYWDGYWDGYTDGYWAGRHRHHHPPVVVSFYYGYYWSDPLWFAFWYPDYYPSVYHYWGWCPGWVYPTRVYYAPAEYVYAPPTIYRYYPSADAVDYVGADRAIQDVRRAWFDSDITSLAYHLTDQLDIQVYFDGEYAYSTTTEDYYAMTVDAMATTQTVAMDFNEPTWMSSREVIWTGRHVFYDPSGGKQTVYVSYRMRRLGGDSRLGGGEWYLVAVGSSLKPIRHTYRDFRYS